MPYPEVDLGAATEGGETDQTGEAEDPVGEASTTGSASPPEPSDDDGEAPTTGPATTEGDGSTGSLVGGTGCADASGLLLCEDFESGEIDGAIWEIVESNGGSVAVVDDRPGLGIYSMRADLALDNGSDARIRTRPGVVFPVPGNHVFGRALVWISADALLGHRHGYFVAVTMLNGSVAEYRLDGTFYGDDPLWDSRYTHASVQQHGGLRKYGPDVVTEQWQCIEWEWNGANNEMRYWFDGVDAPQMTVDGSENPPYRAPPEFTTFGAGWRGFQAEAGASAYSVWVDEIALASERIGCPELSPDR